MGSTTHHAAEITFEHPDNKHGKSRKSDITAAVLRYKLVPWYRRYELVLDSS